jgi:hypothetical protein
VADHGTAKLGKFHAVHAKAHPTREEARKPAHFGLGAGFGNVEGGVAFQGQKVVAKRWPLLREARSSPSGAGERLLLESIAVNTHASEK